MSTETLDKTETAAASPLPPAPRPAESLAVGKINYAHDLYTAFVSEEADKPKMMVLKMLALDVGLTTAQFIEQCKNAQAEASQQDALAGFVADVNAKDATKRYGPKRRQLNTRLSEAKVVFGVFKQAPAALAEKGYFGAVHAARVWLETNGKEWDGNNRLSPADRAKRQEKALVKKALTEVMSEIDMIPGESIADYQMRIAPKAEAAKEKAQDEIFNERVKGFVKRITENTDENVYIEGCLKILETLDIDGLQAAIEYLSEAKMIKIDNNKES